MPAPELTPQTPGDLNANTAPSSTAPTKPTLYTAKHNGGGRWRIWFEPVAGSDGDWFSDFVVTGDGAKEAAQVEADRLNAGGAEYVAPPIDPELANTAPSSTVEVSAQRLDPKTIKTAQLTSEGWLVPEQ